MYGLDTTIAADVQGAVIQVWAKPTNSPDWGPFPGIGRVILLLRISFSLPFNMKWLLHCRIVLFQGDLLRGGAPNMGCPVGRVGLLVPEELASI